MGDVGDRINAWINQRDQLKASDKAAKAIYDALTPPTGTDGSIAANPLGNKDDFLHLSARDRVNAVGGYVQANSMKQAMAEFQTKQQMQALQRQRLQQVIAETASQKQDEDAGQSVLQAAQPYMQAQPAQAGIPGTNIPDDQQDTNPDGIAPSTPGRAALPASQAVLQALMSYRGPGNPTASKTFDSFQKTLEYGDRMSGKGQFYQPGQPAAIDPALADRYVLQPVGPNAAQLVPKGGPAVQLIDDGQGGQIPVMVNGKSATQVKTGAPTAADQLKELGALHRTYVAQAGKAIGPAVDLWTQKADEVAQQMNALVTPKGKSAAGAQPSATDIAYLKANPNLKAKFEARFGAGTAAKYVK